MPYTYQRALFIFRRDLRLTDNTGLCHALKEARRVYPIFIFTPEQVTDNPFKSNNAVQFMVESLNDLNAQLKKKGTKLYLFYGTNQSVLNTLFKDHAIDAVYINKDYTPFSKKRDAAIKRLCESKGIEFHSFDDVCLHPVGTIKTQKDTCYLKFTPFFNAARQHPVKQPKKEIKKNYYTGTLNNTISLAYAHKTFYTNNPELMIHGGSSNGKRILRSIKLFKNYNITRNIPSIATTLLSAHNKFGTLSIRQVYYAIVNSLSFRNDLIKQLYWRDFYYNLLNTYPQLLQKSLKPEYDTIAWKTNKRYLTAWQNGVTGFPLVDAGMRQMNSTGFMHNRARLVTASVLCKVLLINWRKGETYFAQTLLDYDPAQNNGNWAWVSGAGADSQPYFRVFNPFLQSKLFDPECVYIKKWIPQLQTVPNNHIHKWNTYALEYTVDYPAPLVDYTQQKKKVLALYKKALKK